MTTARKTHAILLIAGLVAGVSALLTRAQPASKSCCAGPSDASDPSGLIVQARLQSTHVLLGNEETHMAVAIQAPQLDGALLRPPINVAVVIDRSGSMSGEKLSHAKQSARQLIAQLRPTDRFSIIDYGSDVNLAFASARATEASKASAYRAIDAIYDDGGTNLSGGLIMGREQLMQYPEPNAVSRIVLISDGLANEGIVNRDRLAGLATETAQRGISVTTVGVGLDFDEQTMTQIAVSGRGNYYFAESSFMLADMFENELNKLSTTTATSVRLALSPMPGVEVLEVYGYPMQTEGGRTIVPIADLHAGETRKVVLRIRINADRKGPLKVADVDVSFRPTDSLTTRKVSVVASAAVTGERNTVLTNRDLEAVRHIERARTAKVINEATVQYESGNAAAAMQMLQVRQQETQAIAADMNDPALGAELGEAASAADKDFRAAPAEPGSQAGKRARKAQRGNAYKLMY